MLSAPIRLADGLRATKPTLRLGVMDFSWLGERPRRPPTGSGRSQPETPRTYHRLPPEFAQAEPLVLQVGPLHSKCRTGAYRIGSTRDLQGAPKRWHAACTYWVDSTEEPSMNVIAAQFDEFTHADAAALALQSEAGFASSDVTRMVLSAPGRNAALPIRGDECQ